MSYKGIDLKNFKVKSTMKIVNYFVSLYLVDILKNLMPATAIEYVQLELRLIKPFLP